MVETWMLMFLQTKFNLSKWQWPDGLWIFVWKSCPAPRFSLLLTEFNLLFFNSCDCILLFLITIIIYDCWFGNCTYGRYWQYISVILGHLLLLLREGNHNLTADYLFKLKSQWTWVRHQTSRGQTVWPLNRIDSSAKNICNLSANLQWCLWLIVS